jgi:hypothetical protein
MANAFERFSAEVSFTGSKVLKKKHLLRFTHVVRLRVAAFAEKTPPFGLHFAMHFAGRIVSRLQKGRVVAKKKVFRELRHHEAHITVHASFSAPATGV